jgi:hypothetical protein
MKISTTVFILLLRQFFTSDKHLPEVFRVKEIYEVLWVEMIHIIPHVTAVSRRDDAIQNVEEIHLIETIAAILDLESESEIERIAKGIEESLKRQDEHEGNMRSFDMISHIDDINLVFIAAGEKHVFVPLVRNGLFFDFEFERKDLPKIIQILDYLFASKGSDTLTAIITALFPNVLEHSYRDVDFPLAAKRLSERAEANSSQHRQVTVARTRERGIDAVTRRAYGINDFEVIFVHLI